MEQQYLYIFTVSDQPEGSIKVGFSHQDPHIRAKGLSKNIKGHYIVEWYMEVPNAKDAEKLAHLLLKKYHAAKEYFDIDIDEAIVIIKQGMLNLTGIADPFCFEGPRLRARAKWLRELKLEAAAILAEQEKEERLSRMQTEAGEQAEEQISLTALDRLEQFVGEIGPTWSKKQTSSDGSAYAVGEDEVGYVMKLLTDKQRFDVVYNPDHKLPANLFGIKWRGYFWHFIIVQVRPAVKNRPSKPGTDEVKLFNHLVRFVSDRYVASTLYEDYRDKPIVFSVGVASVRNHRPTTNRCTLVGTEVIKLVSRNLSPDQLTRATNLVEAAHQLT